MKKSLNRTFFLVSLFLAGFADFVYRRKLAINAVLTPVATSRGTESLHADAAIAFLNAVVKKGSDDRHFGATSAQADLPYGILLNDKVNSDEVGVIRKSVAIFGLYPESLDCVSDGFGAIAAGDRIVISTATAGTVKKIPETAGQTYAVIGRSRFSVAATAGDPVSLVHFVPELITNPLA